MEQHIGFSLYNNLNYTCYEKYRLYRSGISISKFDFDFYFGLWHSVLSFDKIRQEFDMPNTFKGWQALLTKAIPYALIAWSGIVVFIYFSLEAWTVKEILPLLFIGIAILALPHLQVFTKIKLDPSK